MKNKIIITLVVFLVVAALFVLRSSNNSTNITQFSPTPSPTGKDVSDMIKLEKPGPAELIKSPVNVSGQARGNWYFEASFPVQIYDSNMNLLGSVPAKAQGDWMTDNFVSFQALLEFKKPSTTGGFLVLKRDNPSGLAQNDAELKVPVTFDLNNWLSGSTTSGGCKITGCSGQICSDQDVTTTCEVKPEYACYKTAKCERQPDGQCGWTPTDQLVQCLSNAFQSESQ